MKLRRVGSRFRTVLISTRKKPFQLKLKAKLKQKPERVVAKSSKLKRRVKPRKFKAKVGGSRGTKAEQKGVSKKGVLSHVTIYIRPMSSAEIDILLGRRTVSLTIQRDPNIEAMVRRRFSPSSSSSQAGLNDSNGASTSVKLQDLLELEDSLEGHQAKPSVSTPTAEPESTELMETETAADKVDSEQPDMNSDLEEDNEDSVKSGISGMECKFL